jgi:hypothetical protein
MKRNALLPVISMLILHASVSAQQEERPLPPPRETQVEERERIEREEPQRLPEFELPEYVITGRATFRLPYVQKPPFNEQSVYVAEIPETMQTGERDIATAPIDLPARSFGEFAAGPSMQYGQVRLGYGRFNTPVVSAWANYRHEEWDLSGRVAYLNTKGYEPFAEGYDTDGRFYVGYRIPATAAPLLRGAKPSVTMGFEGLKHHLKFPEAAGLVSRKFRSTFSEIGFSSGSEAPFDFDLTLGWRGSTLEDGITDEYSFDDDEWYLRLETLGYLGPVRVRSGVTYVANDHNMESPITSQFPDLEGTETAEPRFFNVSALALIPLPDNRLTLEIGGRLYSVQTMPGDGETIVKPFAELRVTPANTLTMYGRFAPEVLPWSLHSMHAVNPYLFFNGLFYTGSFYPSDESINLTAGAEYNPMRSLTVHAYGRYREIDNYPGIASIWPVGTMALTHEGTTKIASINADVRFAASDRDIITTQASFRYSTNDFYDTSVPYIAPVEIAAVYTREIARGLRASAGFEFLSPRRAMYIDGASDDLDMIVRLNLDVQYQFSNIMGVYMQADNLLSHSYDRYHTYLARPFYIEGGIQFSF